MIVMLFTIAQITLLLALTSVCARCAIARSPQLTSTICLIGLSLAAVVIPLALLPLPRLVLDLSQTVQPTANKSIANDQLNPNSSPMEQTTAADGSRLIGWDLKRWIDRLQRVDGEQFSNSLRLTTFFLLAWGVTIALGCVRLIIATVAVICLKRTSRDFCDPKLRQALEQWAQLRQSNLSFNLLVSQSIKSPCVTWLRRGDIYLPDDFHQWGADEQMAVLAHEAAHGFRRDAQWRLLSDLVGLLITFHPLTWLLKRQFVFAQELAADREASWLMSVDKYQYGLCKLALRMDSQVRESSVSFGVSVSTNSLVRRIKMLSSCKSRLAVWQHCLVVMTFVGGSVSLALWTARADETIRIAARSAPTTGDAQTLFSRGASRPWDDVGIQSGYCRVLPSTIAKNHTIQIKLDEIAQDIGFGGLACGVQLSRDLGTWISSFGVAIKEFPEDQRPDARRYAISAEANRLVLQFSREVDWTEVADKINLKALVPHKNEEGLRTFLRQQGVSNTLRPSVSNSSADNDYELAKAIWPLVDGGVTAVVLSLAETHKIDPTYKQIDTPYATWLTVLQNCRFLGAGVDSAFDGTGSQIRLALVPSETNSAQAIAKQVEVAIATTLAADESPASEVEKQLSTSARDFLKDWRVTTKQFDETVGEVVYVEGPVAEMMTLFPLF